MVGPTACGKSGLALELAQRCRGELLCFDSTTVYRGLDIGTAKPTPAERALVPHHLLDLVDTGEEFTLAHFLQAAERALAEVRGQPILVGGTFLYLRAFLEGYQLSEVPPDEEFRGWAEAQPLPDLVTELLRVDPDSAGRVDLANPRRVIRALEVCRSGRRFSALYQRRPRSEPVLKIGLQAEPDWLKQRIFTRCRQMLADGWRQEVAALTARGLAPWLEGMRFIGYPEVLAGSAMSDEQLAQQVAESTWRLVKKQRTWGRSEPDIHWLPADDPRLVERAAELVLVEGEIKRK